MEWISVKERRPEEDIICYVANSRYNSGEHIALYSKDYNVFRLYRPFSHENICLDVTHWVELPDSPKGG